MTKIDRILLIVDIFDKKFTKEQTPSESQEYPN